MSELVVRPLADAFLQVGVYVAVLVAGFGFLQLRFGDRMTDYLARHGKVGVLVAALLGVSPGCGGAILVMPLFVRGKLSFGAVVAALTATMGDSSWIVIAADPGFALRIHTMLFVVGLVTGYAVDLLGIKPTRRGMTARRRVHAGSATAGVPEPTTGSGPASVSGHSGPAAAGDKASRATENLEGLRACGDEPATQTSSGAEAPADASLTGRRRGAVMAAAFWGVTTPAFLLSAPVVFHVVDPAMLRPEVLGGLDLYLAFGAAGTLIALLILAARRFGTPPEHLTDGSSRVKDVLRRSAEEASFITAWVAVAYLGWEAVSRLSGFDGSQLMLTGVSGVVAGALIGLIPGCAVQIVFTGVYVAGGLPLPALVANAVSQDGDALIPLAALDRRAALTAALVTTVPAMLTGLTVLATGL